ncbi:hypothetical protein CHS0354_018405 [Potamilus streckersoni]|uniref:Uncharacterized protein n=1 Tax=Potamilus streckersoni TaxID=2493646 RepID=A0AAE0W9W8_9BIVA|nr:hypothetical protein CHS0354_018405 [Potamilus streckersoni]
MCRSVQVHKTVSVGIRHTGIDFCDNNLRCITCGFDNIDRHPQTDIPMLIRCADPNQGYIRPAPVFIKQARNFRQENSRIIRTPVPHGIADIFADEERIVTEDVAVFCVYIRRTAQRQNVDDFRAADTFRLPHHFPHQPLRFAAPEPIKIQLSGVIFFTASAAEQNLSGEAVTQEPRSEENPAGSGATT